MEENQKILAYQPKTASHRRRRVWQTATFMVAIGLLSWHESARIKITASRVRDRWLVRQCENYQLPPDTVVYECDPALALAYKSDPLYEWVKTDPPYLVRHVPPLKDFPWGHPSTYRWDEATFCHARTSKSGRHRLVVVDGDMHGMLIAMVIDPGSFMTPPDEISTTGVDPWKRYDVLAARPESLISFFAENHPIYTLYAGQPDPKDASHFTFRYVAKGGTGTIDGWLLDNDKIRFRVLDGPYGQSLSYFVRNEKEFDN